jgi:hypothetical protein
MELVTKITLIGPRPFGGSLTCDIDSPYVEEAMQDGYTVWRIWQFEIGVRNKHEIFHA